MSFAKLVKKPRKKEGEKGEKGRRMFDQKQIHSQVFSMPACLSLSNCTSEHEGSGKSHWDVKELSLISRIYSAKYYYK